MNSQEEQNNTNQDSVFFMEQHSFPSEWRVELLQGEGNIGVSIELKYTESNYLNIEDGSTAKIKLGYFTEEVKENGWVNLRIQINSENLNNELQNIFSNGPLLLTSSDNYKYNVEESIFYNSGKDQEIQLKEIVEEALEEQIDASRKKRYLIFIKCKYYLKQFLSIIIDFLKIINLYLFGREISTPEFIDYPKGDFIPYSREDMTKKESDSKINMGGVSMETSWRPVLTLLVVIFFSFWFIEPLRRYGSNNVFWSSLLGMGYLIFGILIPYSIFYVINKLIELRRWVHEYSIMVNCFQIFSSM